MNRHTTEDLNAQPSRILLRGRRLAAARAAWVVIASLVAALSVAGLPALYGEYRALSYPDFSNPAAVRANLAELGLSTGFYAAYLLALVVVLSAACFVVATVIFWRRSDEPMVLFVAMLLVLLGVTFSGSVGVLGDLDPVWERLSSVLNALLISAEISKR